MAQQGKGKGFAVVLSMVAIAGVVAYVLYRRYKKKKDEMPSIDSGTTFTPAPTPTSTDSGSGSGSGSGSSTSNGNPFATKDDLIKFQRWVIVTKGDKTILGKGGSTGFGDDGAWGSKSASAYAKYQKDFNPSITNQDGTVQGASLPSWMIPTNSGTTTTSSPKLKQVVSTDYVNFYQKPSSFLPFNTLPYGRNEILGTTDGKEYYDGNTPYYLVNIPKSMQGGANNPSGLASGYVKARAVRLQ